MGGNALAALVDEVCAANGWSRREVARRAQARGRALSSSRLGQLLNQDPLPGIQAERIDDIAVGLGIGRDRVAVAAIEALGFALPDSAPGPAEAVRQDPTLPEPTRQALLAVLAAAGR